MSDKSKLFEDRIKYFLKENPKWSSSHLSGSFSDLILTKEEVIKNWEFTMGKRQRKIKEQVESIQNEIIFGFKNSFVVFDKGILSTQNGKIFNFDSLKSFKIDKPKGFLSVKGYFTKENNHIDNLIGFKDFDGEILKKFLTYLYGHKEEKIVTKTKPTTKKRELQKELVKLLRNQNKELNDVSKIRNSIKIKQSSILKESFLNKTPIKLNFTVVISSKMKSIQNDFNDSQLNKLTRFLSFLEENEVKYNSLYEEGVNQYIDNPESDVFQQISVKYLSILNYYQIFSLMLNNINTDKVTFNKLYNIIEDEGIFMTRTEVDTMDYFKKISKGISQLNNNLISEFYKLNKGINNLNMGLQYLDGSLQMIDSSLSLIEKNTNNIYLTI